MADRGDYELANQAFAANGRRASFSGDLGGAPPAAETQDVCLRSHEWHSNQTRVTVKKPVRRDIQDRAAEYVDSALMTQRLRNRRQLSARVEGHYGVYRTSLQLGKPADSRCTCPSEAWPCKHLRALRLTWEKPKKLLRPRRFLEGTVGALKARPFKHHRQDGDPGPGVSQRLWR